MAHSDFLATAIDAARAAQEVIEHYYRGDFSVTLKADHSPVTEADVACERAIKEVLSARFPDHGFYGEELGQQAMDAEYVWLIDPIDGTKSFVRGYPFFSTQIALMRQGDLIAGVSNAPCFGPAGEMAVAERGAGAWLNGERINVSDITELEQATLSIGNVTTLAGSGRWSELGQLIRLVSRIRGYGDFYHYHLLASGRVEVVIESDVNILDIAALTVILREAGGEITDLEGAPVGLDTRSVLASNGRLRAAVRKVLI